MLIIGVFKGLHIPTSWREWGIYILLGCYRELPLSSRFNEGLLHNPSGYIKYYYGFDIHDDSAFSVSGL